MAGPRVAHRDRHGGQQRGQPAGLEGNQQVRGMGLLRQHGGRAGAPVPTATVDPFSNSRAATQIINSVAL